MPVRTSGKPPSGVDRISTLAKPVGQLSELLAGLSTEVDPFEWADQSCHAATAPVDLLSPLCFLILIQSNAASQGEGRGCSGKGSANQANP